MSNWENRFSFIPDLTPPAITDLLSFEGRISESNSSEIVQAVVVSSIQDPSLLDVKDSFKIYESLDNEDRQRFLDNPGTSTEQLDKKIKQYFLKVPRNSMLVSLIQDSKNTNTRKIAYPFFSSHLMLPAKVGEHVWCYKIGTAYYWMTRIHGSDSYEDVNYTHENRAADPSRIVKDAEFTPVPDFPNSRDAQGQTVTFQEDNSGKEPYDELLNASKQSNLVFEPVPRITPRPGDLVLQGSNNATIMLSTQRGYGKKQRPAKGKSNSEMDSADNVSESGAIDIVTGRGRKKPSSSKDHDEASTQAREIRNSRDEMETNKNPLYYESGSKIDKDRSEGNDKFCGNVSMDVPEGDPDFINDAARVYVSMKMNSDDLLGLNDYCPVQVAKPGASNAGNNIPESKESSTVLLRADEIRIVARKDDERSINGSIRIVKEGKRDDVNGSGSATIMIQPDGTIVIDGPKILIGGGQLIGDHGSGNQVSIGLDATEPLILGKELETRLGNFMDAVIEFLGIAENHTHPGFPGPYPPDPIYKSQCQFSKQKVETSRNELQKILSKIGKTR